MISRATRRNAWRKVYRNTNQSWPKFMAQFNEAVKKSLERKIDVYNKQL